MRTFLVLALLVAVGRAEPVAWKLPPTDLVRYELRVVRMQTLRFAEMTPSHVELTPASREARQVK